MKRLQLRHLTVASALWCPSSQYFEKSGVEDCILEQFLLYFLRDRISHFVVMGLVEMRAEFPLDRFVCPG